MKKGLRLAVGWVLSAGRGQNDFPDEEGIKTLTDLFLFQGFESERLP
ncbi:hypothetical protein TVNIR_1464 [Thioalkalivibrio nitratireducens DSM 14787]|uniref:Uncharacterized protein n=1 Tax=Thioalkalivibrio nitratireducens (strain DSM 14787 / UNIQEM 213 / ALEN2) TaxID=1255043 RepID=L0DU57_THIND|nr:hypothetical protein TVNIR_1464 [Thioalkalivibrio nitratireducens DSM 14787]